jgi:hypothetical protein
MAAPIPREDLLDLRSAVLVRFLVGARISAFSASLFRSPARDLVMLALVAMHVPGVVPHCRALPYTQREQGGSARRCLRCVTAPIVRSLPCLHRPPGSPGSSRRRFIITLKGDPRCASTRGASGGHAERARLWCDRSWRRCASCRLATRSRMATVAPTPAIARRWRSCSSRPVRPSASWAPRATTRARCAASGSFTKGTRAG